MTPLTIVTFKWKTPGYRAVFESKHVNILRRMVLRHYPDPVRFVCFTDEPAGLAEGIEAHPLWDDHRRVPNPTGGGRPGRHGAPLARWPENPRTGAPAF